MFCELFDRWHGPGPDPVGGEQPGQVLGNSLISAGVNFATRVRKGIDTEAAYQAPTWAAVKLDTRI